MKEENKKSKALETILILVAALIILFWIYHKKIFLLVSLILILIATTSEFLTKKISLAWLKFSEAIGKVMSKVILTAVYFIILVPLAFLFRLTGKDQLQLKRKKDSYFVERNHLFSKKDIENIW